MPKLFKNRCDYSIVLMLVLFCVTGCKNQQQKPEQLPLAMANPAQGYAGMSRLFASDVLLYMSWVEQQDSLAVLKYASFNGALWSDTNTIASGTDWFVNWADFPSIAVNNENVFVHYLEKSAPDTYAYNINYKVFSKAKGQWSDTQKLHTDTTKSEHGFVSVMPYGAQGFMASWLDGRNTVNVPDSLRQMTLRAAIINPNGSLEQDWELDQRVCDCCATAIANTPEGPMVVYRDRSATEIRDINWVTFNDSTWTAPKAMHNDNWEINGCPVNGPAVASSEFVTATAWFTMANEQPLVKLSIANANLKTQEGPIVVDSSNVMGRVNVAVDNAGNAYVIWMSDQGAVAFINLKIYDPLGTVLHSMTLAETSIERASGFPQLALFKNKLYVSYTDANKETSQIKSVVIPLQAFEFLK